MEEIFNKEKSCVFTGHRNLKEDFDERSLEKEIINLVKKGVITFYTGMAIGFDMIAAEKVLKVKKRNPFIKLIACVPFYGQEKFYSQIDKERYVDILKKADEKVTLSERYSNYAYMKRNKYMADRCFYMIAYLKEENGGTALTVDYFKKNVGGEIIYI